MISYEKVILISVIVFFVGNILGYWQGAKYTMKLFDDKLK